MIVTVNAWIFIISAVCAVLPVPELHKRGVGLASWFIFLLFMSLGVGLLRRRNWARWISLGASLFTWTVGSLLFLWSFFNGIRVYNRTYDMSFGVVLVFLFGFALCVCLLWLSYRLFWHLNSDEGREEFDTPVTERNAVLKSSMAYIASLMIVGVVSALTAPDTKAARLEAMERAEQARVKARRDGIPLPGDLEAQQRDAERTTELEAQQVDGETLADQRHLDAAEARHLAMFARLYPQADQGAIQRRVHELYDRRRSDQTYTDDLFAVDMEQLEQELTN